MLINLKCMKHPRSHILHVITKIPQIEPLKSNFNVKLKCALFIFTSNLKHANQL